MKSIQNTNLTIGLVTMPVKIFSAGGKDAEIHLNYCGPKGEAVERVYRVVETGEVVDHDNLNKSYNGSVISKLDLTNVEEASLRDEEGRDLKQIYVERFVPLKDIPFERVSDLYYVGPDLKTSDGDALMYLIEGLKKRKAAAIAKVVLRSRQKCFALFVKDDILHAVALKFAQTINLREDSELRTEDFKAKRPVLEQMLDLIDAQTGEASYIDGIEDTFVKQKRALIEEVQSGQKVKAVKSRPVDGTDLLASLEASAKAARKAKTKEKA